MAKESKAQETTIVKATPKKVDSQKDEQPRGTVKAASISQVRTLGANKQVKHQTAQQERPAHRPPLGTPVVNKDLENRSKPPIGKPMGKPVVPKEVAERGKTSAEAEAAQAAEMPKGSRWQDDGCAAGNGSTDSAACTEGRDCRACTCTESGGSGAAGSRKTGTEG